MEIPEPASHFLQGAPEFGSKPLIAPAGFRETDARWWYGLPGSEKAPELNLAGAYALGMGIATLMRELGAGPEIVTGHDFRSYSVEIKNALIAGMMAAGAQVHEIGLALTPMAYFAQFALNVPAIAMVTASHNDNGWTGVKMGSEPAFTFGPEEMGRLREIVLNGEYRPAAGGSLKQVESFGERYIDDLTDRAPFKRRIRAVVACGNGTAGAFAPKVLERLGIEVIAMDTELDDTFPNYNPNPEDMRMLNAMANRVRESGADLAFGFDGDGDRCGVVDNTGRVIFADIIGVMLARDIASANAGSRFVTDVKSTSLFLSDPVLTEHGAKMDYFRTGHSYIKRRMKALNAIAGFEKSGHFYFNAPFGRGYDDGILAAIAICGLLERNPGKTLSELRDRLPPIHALPPIGLFCPDAVKHDVVRQITARFEDMKEKGLELGGMAIRDCLTIHGIRAVTGDGSWVLVRASSNEPKLVVVAESPVSQSRCKEMFDAAAVILREFSEIGDVPEDAGQPVLL